MSEVPAPWGRRLPAEEVIPGYSHSGNSQGEKESHEQKIKKTLSVPGQALPVPGHLSWWGRGLGASMSAACPVPKIAQQLPGTSARHQPRAVSDLDVTFEPCTPAQSWGQGWGPLPSRDPPTQPAAIASGGGRRNSPALPFPSSFFWPWGARREPGISRNPSVSATVRLHDSISEEGHHYLIFDL